MGATMNVSLNTDLSGAIDMAPWDDSVNTGFTFTQDPDEAMLARFVSTTQNNEATYVIEQPKPGDWVVSLLCTKGPDKGIASIYFDGVKFTEVDMYAASETPGIATSPVFRLTDGLATEFKLVMESKNASSSGYAASLNHIGGSRQ